MHDLSLEKYRGFQTKNWAHLTKPKSHTKLTKAKYINANVKKHGFKYLLYILGCSLLAVFSFKQSQNVAIWTTIITTVHAPL